MGDTVIINGILYLVVAASDLQQMFGITIDSEVGLIYVGPESGTFTEEVIEVPESITAEGQTIPVVGFAGGITVLETGNETAAASVSEVILPSSILFILYGFFGFTSLQKVTCYAETTPKLSSEIGGTAGYDFEGTPSTKELYIPTGSDYSTWTAETTWESVNEIYDGFVEIVAGLKYKETSETTVALIGYDETFNSTSITIPSSITHEGNTYTVTEIKNNAFKNYTGLTEVNIPDSVTKISETAFSNITNFETQTISVNNISLNLIGKNTKIDEFVFKNTSEITFTYGNITETSVEYACECLGLTNTTISTPTLDLTNLTYDGYKLSIYTIKNRAFANNNSIITAILPEETKLIEEYIFYNCQNIDTVYFNCKSAQTVIDSTYGPIPSLGYNNSIKTIIIGDSVTSIKNYVFMYCSSLTSITIPNSVTSIGDYAFYGCSSLTSVTIPNSVTSIGDYAFYGCSSLTSVTLHENIIISTNAFWGCGTIDAMFSIDNLNYALYYNNDNIGNYTFEGAYNVTFTIGDIVYTPSRVMIVSYTSELNGDVTLPSSVTYNSASYPVTYINQYTFADCSSLTSVTIPNSVTSIGNYAFSDCSSLTSVTIGNSVTSIGTYAFYGCSSLTSVTIPNSVTSIGEGTFAGCSSLTSVTIGNSVTSIRECAFYGCSGLTSVTIPDSVTSIGEDAFSGCLFENSGFINNSSLDEVSNNYWGAKIYDEITDEGLVIQENIVIDTRKNITSVTIPDSVTSIGERAFSGCRSLTSVIIPNSVTSIGDSVFDGCSSLTSIDIPNGVTSIGERAFYGCSNLTSVTIPENVTSIGNYAFRGCSKLNTLNFNAINCNDFTTGNSPFSSYITTINIGENVQKIPTHFAYNLNKLTSVIIPDSVTSIGGYAFYGCSSLTSVTIPDSVTSIRSAAFSGCSKLNTLNFNAINCNDFTTGNSPFSSYITTINIGENVQKIPTHFAYNLNKLTSVIIPDSVTSIGGYAFYGCSSLTSVTIPDSVTSIRSAAFSGCSKLTSVTIPDSVTSIGAATFSGCSKLTSVTLSNNIKALLSSYNVSGKYSDGLFRNCSSLTSITIPNSVTSIGAATFSGCTSLINVTIGNSVTSIGGQAFYGCSSLTSVYLLIPTAINITDSSIFNNTPSTKVLFVPIDATDYTTSWGSTTWAAVNYTMVPTEEINYKSNDTNTIETFSSNNKTETLTIPNTVTYNGNTFSVNKLSRNSLANDNVVKSLTIESGINKIEASAFSGCISMETINLPETISHIGRHAFWFCKGLKNITLPNTLTYLKPEMFVACEELETITIPNGITIIPFRMFEGCKKLKTVNLPSTITEIQWSAFKDCVSLTNINKPDVCDVDPTAFEGTNIQFK